ncbi:MAG: hypothetical protein R3F46_04065 [bacterium]
MGEPLHELLDEETIRYATFIRLAVIIGLICAAVVLFLALFFPTSASGEELLEACAFCGSLAFLLANLIILLRFHPWRIADSAGWSFTGSASWVYTLIFSLCAAGVIAILWPLFQPVTETGYEDDLRHTFGYVDVLRIKTAEFMLAGVYLFFPLLFNLVYFGRVLDFLAPRAASRQGS